VSSDRIDEEARAEEAITAAQAAHEREPSDDTWGFEAYGDAPGGIGGGAGGFLWFSARQEVVDFLRRHLVFLYTGPVTIERGPVLEQVQQTVDRYESGGLDALGTIDALNAALRHFSQLRWLGQLRDLLETDAEFPREVRSWWREGSSERGSGTSGDPIQPGDTPDFVARLRDEWE
jgi:hypothetical protein